MIRLCECLDTELFTDACIISKGFSCRVSNRGFNNMIRKTFLLNVVDFFIFTQLLKIRLNMSHRNIKYKQ